MKKIALLISILLTSICKINAQAIRVAILDFENNSGIAQYDGLGKAMSSMLISDIEANVSPQRLQLVERSQIQKVLKEQNFQASGNVDKSTAVQAGKILGVAYLLIGDVYILNDQLIINARLINSETGDIIFSKKQEGKTIGWLTLKTIIAKDLATSLSQPFKEPTIPDKNISIATLTTFGNAILAKDVGDNPLAEKIIETLHENNPDFKYLDDLKLELVEIKKKVEQNSMDIILLEKSGGKIINAISPLELMNNMTNPNSNYNERKVALESILNFPLDSILYIYGYNANLATFYAYPASSEGYTFTCNDLDYFVKDLNFLLGLSEKTTVNKASLKYFMQCKLDYFHGDISRTHPKLVADFLKLHGIVYEPPKVPSDHFTELLKCESEKWDTLQKIMIKAKLFIGP